MANFISHLFLLFTTLILVNLVSATDHVVGDRSGWTTGVDYFSWTTGKTFFVGDNLIFRYKKGSHNVFDVNVTAFSECATPSNQPPLETGNDVVRLLRPGTKWFICNIGHHCQSGQKLIISVQSLPPTPPLVGQASPPPSSIPSLTPSVEPSSPSPSSLPPTPAPSLPPTPAASSPSVPSPGQNQTNPQSPAPTPSGSIPPSHSPVPSATPPSSSAAAAKFAVSGYLRLVEVAVAVLTGFMI